MRGFRAALAVVVLAILACAGALLGAFPAAAGSVSLTVAPESENPCVGYSAVTLTAAVTGPPVVLDLMHRPAGGEWSDAGQFSYDQGSQTYAFSISEPSAGSYDYAAVVEPAAAADPVQPQLTLPWNDPALTLAQDTSSSQVSTNLGLSVALSCVQGGDITFQVEGPGAATAPNPVAVTGSDVQTTYTSNAGGTDSVTASYRVCSDVVTGACDTFRSNTVEHEWTLPVASLQLSAPATSCVGSSATLSAVVEVDGSPISGAQVSFAIL
jgi:hypothetical protein